MRSFTTGSRKRQPGGWIGEILLNQKRNAEAAELLFAAQPHARKTYSGASERSLAMFLSLIGRARNRVGQYSAAEGNLLEANASYVKTRGPEHADTLSSIKLLVEFYTAWAKTESGRGHDAKAAEWKANLPTKAPPEKK